MVEIIPIQTKVVVILVTRKVAETEVETEEVMAVVIVENQDFLRLHAGATVPPEVLRRPIRAGMTMEETEEEDTKEAVEVEAATMIDAAVAIRAAGVAAEEEVASVVVEEEVTGMNAASKVT